MRAPCCRAAPAAPLTLGVLSPLAGSIKFQYWEKWTLVSVIPLVAGAALFLLYVIVALRKVSLQFGRRGRVRQLRIVENTMVVRSPSASRGARAAGVRGSADAESKEDAEEQVSTRVAQQQSLDALSGTNTLDAFIGLYTTALYFMYFVVVRNALTIFACSPNIHGVPTMNAEPSIVCNSTDPWYPRLFFWACVFTALFGGGIPIAFFIILWVHRKGIRVDQQLRKLGEGDTPAQNPYFAVRRRFSKLYQVRAAAMCVCVYCLL